MQRVFQSPPSTECPFSRAMPAGAEADHGNVRIFRDAVVFAENLSRRAGQFLLRRFGRVTRFSHKKERVNLVTDADKGSERLIVRSLRKRFPRHQIVGEEGADVRVDSAFRWFVDPLDGTVNFVHGLPIFSVSIGLTFLGRPVAGVVYDPTRDDLFSAVATLGARRNGRPIRVSSNAALRDALLVTGFPYSLSGRRRQARLFEKFVLRSRAVRRLGSAAIDLCYVAAGLFDGFWEFGLRPWDIAAGVVILQEAGGRFTDFSGAPGTITQGDVVASNSRIHAAMLRVLRP